MKLIETADQWYKMYVVQALAAVAAIQVTMATLPPAIVTTPIYKGLSLNEMVSSLSAIISLAGIVLRLIKQPALATPAQPDVIPNPELKEK